MAQRLLLQVAEVSGFQRHRTGRQFLAFKTAFTDLISGGISYLKWCVIYAILISYLLSFARNPVEGGVRQLPKMIAVERRSSTHRNIQSLGGLSGGEYRGESRLQSASSEPLGFQFYIFITESPILSQHQTFKANRVLKNNLRKSNVEASPTVAVPRVVLIPKFPS